MSLLVFLPYYLFSCKLQFYQAMVSLASSSVCLPLLLFIDSVSRRGAVVLKTGGKKRFIYVNIT